MSLFSKLKILPIMICVVTLSFVIRLGDFVTNVKANMDGNVAMAQQEVHDSKPPLGPSPEGTDMTHDESASDNKDTDGSYKPWRDAEDADIDFSNAEMELLQSLSKRRDTLDKREQYLNQREALLKAAETQLDRKYKELEELRTELEKLLGQQKDDEKKRIESLVKIYEGMKAKDAAVIFNTLDTNVLLAVISRMSERKSSPILAEMNPDRARAITILLAEQKQLPGEK